MPICYDVFTGNEGLAHIKLGKIRLFYIDLQYLTVSRPWLIEQGSIPVLLAKYEPEVRIDHYRSDMVTIGHRAKCYTYIYICMFYINRYKKKF